MSESESYLEETVTLNQANQLIRCLAHQESILLLSPPGVGKSDTVLQAAKSAGLPCRSLLGTQIAPEDVSGVPRIIDERSVFCPPRVLLPESNEPFCLFLDELPACTPDIQKAFYSLLLERRIGEHLLPPGSWVVAAGNRVQDRALVRTISSALINRVLVLNVRVDVDEWLAWAGNHDVDPTIRAFISEYPDALLRPIPKDSVPFSTPRAWTLLSDALRLALDEDDRRQLPLSEQNRLCRALAAGRISAEDVTNFSNWWVFSQQHVANRTYAEYRSVLGIGICELALPQRVINQLQSDELITVQKLAMSNRVSLNRLQLDAMHLDEIEQLLNREGLWLGMQF